MSEDVSIIKKINRRFILPLRRGVRHTALFPYYFIRTHPVTARILNREGRELYRSKNQPLSKIQSRIAADLERDGFAVIHLDELFSSRDLLPVLRAYADTLLAKAREGRKKKFLEFGWPEDRQPVEFDNPLLRLTLEPATLAIAAAYLDTAPKLSFFSCNRTLPVGDHTEAQGSQRWHRDPGVGRILKLFLYLSDVDESAGPFTYVAGSHNGGRFGDLFKVPLFGRYGIYPPPGAVEDSVPRESIKIGTGRAGTIIFCDTLGLHRGGYATTRQRLMYTALFEAPSAFRRHTLALPAGPVMNARISDPMARFALTR